ncbi:MAG: type VII toxin-antitoxin system HepT family RNase toxin [Desulfohalobiaceae bacterium]
MSLNIDRLRSKLNDISRSLNRLRSLQSLDKEKFLQDEDAQDIARSRLLTAMEAALNICYHICAKKLKTVPEDYSQCFLLLADSGLISQDLARSMALMARFRNRLVHLYWDIDYAQVHEIMASRLDDLENFASQTATLINPNA